MKKKAKAKVKVHAKKAPITHVETGFEFDSTSSQAISTALIRAGLAKEEPKRPTLLYLPTVKATIDAIVRHAPQEVGWVGTVKALANNSYVVTEVFIPQQQVCAVETEIDSDAMAELAMKLMDNNKDPGTLYYWGHSHVNMAVNPSGQDEDQIDEFLQTCPLFIRGIYNKAGASRVDIYDVEAEVVHQNVNEGLYTTTAMENKIKTEITDRVKTRVITPAYAGNAGYQNNGYWNGAHRANNYWNKHANIGR